MITTTPLTLPEVAEIVGVEYRTLHTWVKRGILQPSLRSASGAGRPNLFAEHDVIAAKVVVDLRKAGVPLDQLAEAGKLLHECSESIGLEPRVLLVNGKVELIEPDELADKLTEKFMKKHNVNLVYYTGDAHDEVEKLLRKRNRSAAAAAA